MTLDDIKREEGYYWIKIDNRWEVAKYFNSLHLANKWFIVGYRTAIDNKDIEAVNENQIVNIISNT